VRLALDHHCSQVIAARLRERGHDVVTAHERVWHLLSDEVLLERCAAERRSLVTNNVRDLVAVAQRWAEEGRHHAGLVLTSDVSLPRTHATIGTYVERLDELLTANPTETAFVDRIHWL
jgi:hypothetical protein